MCSKLKGTEENVLFLHNFVLKFLRKEDADTDMYPFSGETFVRVFVQVSKLWRSSPLGVGTSTAWSLHVAELAERL